jgi:small-conductance mechanosensitive channel
MSVFTDTLKDLTRLDHVLISNPLRDWLIALGLSLGIILVAAFLKRVAITRLSVLVRRHETRADAAVVKAIQATRLWLVAVVAIEVGSQYLDLPHRADATLQRAMVIAAFAQAGLWLAAVLDFWIVTSRNRALATDVGAATSLAAFSFIGRWALWAVMLLLMLDNLGVNISTLVASLGVGGIAMALAVQNVLGDVLASLSIVTDKPFVIGDSIAVDGLQGTVEHVGLKTTRLRSSTGEELVFANSDLLKARLHNYKRMQERCITFGFGVQISTTPDQLEKIPALVRGVIDGRNKLRFDRVHFKEIGESGFRFEVVYWLLDPDYTLYMDTQQAINLGLLRALDKEGVGLAHPVRMIVGELAAKSSSGPG